MIEHRWIDLQGVANMRDVGGLPTSDGGTIATGRLVRSDNLQELTEPDITHLLDEVGVSDIVDLRSHAEERAEGPGPLRAFDRLGHHHHSLYPDDAEVTGADALLLPWAKELDGEERPESQDEAFWSAHYLRYLAQRPDSVLAALAVVRDASGAVLVHCAAGKDRTGTVVGLALDAAGVPAEAIATDYAASAQRITQIIERLSRRPAYAEHLQGQSVDDQTPKAESMLQLLAAMHERFGGAEGWLRESGWSASEVDALRDRLRH
ncbi:MAG: tyrosine-protein phosphatase [Micrococcales bacterium]|nr:tyrosine-protein phosphatase [Micrococcales bacterium]